MATIKVITWGDPNNENTPLQYGLTQDNKFVARKTKAGKLAPLLFATKAEAAAHAKVMRARLKANLKAVFDEAGTTV